jgi:hypothetical protein
VFGDACPHGCEQGSCVQAASALSLRCNKCKNGLIVDKITGYCGELVELTPRIAAVGAVTAAKTPSRSSRMWGCGVNSHVQQLWPLV